MNIQHKQQQPHLLLYCTKNLAVDCSFQKVQPDCHNVLWTMTIHLLIVHANCKTVTLVKDEGD